MYLPIYLSFYLSICQCIYVFVCLSIGLCNLSINYLSNSLSVSVCLSINLFIYIGLVFRHLQTIARLIQRLNTAAGKLVHTIIPLLPVENISSALTCIETLEYARLKCCTGEKVLVKLVSWGGSTFVDSGCTKSFLLGMLLNRRYPNTQYITMLFLL